MMSSLDSRPIWLHFKSVERCKVGKPKLFDQVTLVKNCMDLKLEVQKNFKQMLKTGSISLLVNVRELSGAVE